MEEMKEDYYTSLYDIAAVINSSLRPEEVLSRLVKNVADTTKAKGCSIMLLTPDRKLLLHTGAYGLSDWYFRKGPVSADQSISEVLTGRPVDIFDATTDERVQYREQAKHEGIASILSVPMMLRGEVIGVVRVYSAEQREFTEDGVRFVEAVANLGAIALENARLYDAVQKDYDEYMRDVLEWRAALGHEWMIGESVDPAEEKPKPVEPG